MEKPIQAQTQTHVLFELSPLDAREDIDDKTQRTYQHLKQVIAGKTPKECHDIYIKYLAANPQHHTEELTMGLLVAILVEQDGQQNKYYRDIVSLSKDGLNLFSTYLNFIIIERSTKLRDHSTKQIFWITHQLMKANIAAAENICSNILRQMAGGDLSAKNLKLIENLLELLVDNRSWLINSTQFMTPTVIYTFMRLITDHMGPAQSSLRQKEVEFVIGLIREKFLECLHIGRDFLRLLHDVIKIPEFEKLWHDIHNDPKSLHPNFQSSLRLLSNRTPRRLFQSRLTFDMERKISFLATQVKFGNQKRYQDWFHKQYLSTPESLSLRCDLIRYICSIIHPSNEVLCSDIIPRWAIIGWLLTTCTTSASATSSKLALFFDWLLYDARVDNIMNIEPAILVMYYSMRSHPNVTASLLEFLCRMPAIFSPKLSEQIKAGIKKSLQQILEKRVVASLVPLFDNPKHDPALKALMRDTFPEFCHNDNGVLHPHPQPQQPAQPGSALPPAQQIIHSPTVPNHVAKKEPEVIILDQDKVTSMSETIPAPVSGFVETVGSNKTLTNQETNHITNKTVDHLIPAHNEVKATEPCATTPPSSSSSLSYSPSSSIVRDETKAFSWNGTENANASYSHKQNHDNKIRKSSMSNSAAIDSARRNATEACGEIIRESLENNSKNSTPNVFNSEQNSDHGENSSLKVIYPFMRVNGINFKETLNSFEDPIRSILEDLSIERSAETRCALMDKLISVVFDDSEQSNNSCILKDLGRCIASIVVDDISTRIFPSSSQDNESLEESIATPFFVLCRSAFSDNRSTQWAQKLMSLLAAVSKCLEATVTAFVNGASIYTNYLDFCNSAKRKLTDCLYEDLLNTLTYDATMFCFLLPSVFGELAMCGSFPVTGNVRIIQLVVSAIDPICLQELICLCLTGAAKVVSKEDALTLIESSLTWESWEQYCVWKLISAQNVPVENYISILPKLDSKANAEAMSCILLNLQKISEPTVSMLQQIINCESTNDMFISTILRYWSMKTDVKELAKMISSLPDSRPTSPQVKRKGQTKVASKQPSNLSLKSEKILAHLDSVRQRAPKNRLLGQTEILEMIAHLETLCNESQKKRFSDLFSNRTKPTKKQKKMDSVC